MSYNFITRLQEYITNPKPNDYVSLPAVSIEDDHSIYIFLKSIHNSNIYASFFKRQKIMCWLSHNSLWESCKYYSQFIAFSHINLYVRYTCASINETKALKILSMYDYNIIIKETSLFSLFFIFTKLLKNNCISSSVFLQ